MPPIHPGKMLRSLFMDELGLTAAELSARTAHPAPYIEALTRQEEHRPGVWVGEELAVINKASGTREIVCKIGAFEVTRE